MRELLKVVDEFSSRGRRLNPRRLITKWSSVRQGLCTITTPGLSGFVLAKKGTLRLSPNVAFAQTKKKLILPKNKYCSIQTVRIHSDYHLFRTFVWIILLKLIYFILIEHS